MCVHRHLYIHTYLCVCVCVCVIFELIHGALCRFARPHPSRSPHPSQGHEFLRKVEGYKRSRPFHGTLAPPFRRGEPLFLYCCLLPSSISCHVRRRVSSPPIRKVTCLLYLFLVLWEHGSLTTTKFPPLSWVVLDWGCDWTRVCVVQLFNNGVLDSGAESPPIGRDLCSGTDAQRVRV